jgi:hypothetical protein
MSVFYGIHQLDAQLNRTSPLIQEHRSSQQDLIETIPTNPDAGHVEGRLDF